MLFPSVIWTALHYSLYDTILCADESLEKEEVASQKEALKHETKMELLSPATIITEFGTDMGFGITIAFR